MRVLVINLDRCPERLAQTMSEFARWGLCFERVPAVDGMTLPISDGQIVGFKKQGYAKEHYYKGTAGCYFSHRLALERAIEADVWPCLICEDDVVLTASPILPETEKSIVYLGGLDVPGKGVYGGHAVCYKTKEAASAALAEATSKPDSWDGCLVRLQRKADIFHFHRPYPIKQRAGFSHIVGKHLKGRG